MGSIHLSKTEKEARYELIMKLRNEEENVNIIAEKVGLGSPNAVRVWMSQYRKDNGIMQNKLCQNNCIMQNINLHNVNIDNMKNSIKLFCETGQWTINKQDNGDKIYRNSKEIDDRILEQAVKIMKKRGSRNVDPLLALAYEEFVTNKNNKNTEEDD